MSRVETDKISDGVYLISWIILGTYDTNGKTAVDITIEKGTSQLCQLSYSTEKFGNGSPARLELEFLPDSILPSNTENSPILEPTSVLAIKYDVRLPMRFENSKWTIKFPKIEECCGLGDLIFHILIDFNPKIAALKRAASKRIMNHLLDLWETKTLADVTFKFEEKQIQAHSLILASGSPVFAAMFQHDFKEKQEKVVEVKDVKPFVFEKLLRFIYIGDPDFEKADLADLLVVADKYGMDSLKEECARRLVEDLTIENAIKYLVLSHLHNLTSMYESTLDFVSKNSKEICSRKESWMELMKNYPELSFAVMQKLVMGC